LEVDLTEVNFFTANHRSQYDGNIVFIVIRVIRLITLLIKGKIVIPFQLFRMRYWIGVYEVLFRENHRKPKSKFESRKEVEALDSHSMFENDIFHVDSGNQSETAAESTDSVSLTQHEMLMSQHLQWDLKLDSDGQKVFGFLRPWRVMLTRELNVHSFDLWVFHVHRKGILLGRDLRCKSNISWQLFGSRAHLRSEVISVGRVKLKIGRPTKDGGKSNENRNRFIDKNNNGISFRWVHNSVIHHNRR
jgi:hypothetical protein